MKLLDIFGTSSNSFSIGLGEEKIEFRTINGELHFRNFGTGYQKASSESLKESLRVRDYNTETNIGENELLQYNGALWYSKQTFISTSWEWDLKYLVKISDISNFFAYSINTITSNSLALTASSSKNIHISGSTSLFSSLSIYLPIASLLEIGREFIINNGSEIPLEIHRFNTNTPVIIIKPRERASLLLLSNVIESGEWAPFNFSSASGGGGGSGLIEANLNLTQYPNNQNPFSIGDIVTYNPDTIAAKWDKGLSNNFNAEIMGVVSALSGQTITVQISGLVSGLSDLISGKKYYLSPTTSGALTDSPGIYNVPVLIANSESTGYLISNDPNSRFNRISIITLNVGSSYKLNYGNYSFTIDGYVIGDHRGISFSGHVFSGPTSDAIITTISEFVIDSDSAGFLCFYQSGNDIYLKNNLETSVDIRVNIRGSL